MKKKVLLLTLLLIVTFTSSAYAVDIMIDDDYVVFNDTTGNPFVDANGRTLVPLRATMEKYGATVTWDDVNKIAIVNYNGIIVEVPIGQNYIIKDGEKLLNDTSALVKDNRTYLPIRIVLESFGSSVGWQNEFQRVIVNKYRDYSVTAELKKMGFEEWQSAITYNDEEALREMFTGKYDINNPSSNGTYPLEYAITVNSTDMVKLMIELGANTQQVNSVGQSMVEIAKQKKYMNIVEILAPGTVEDISNSSNNIEWRLEGHEAVYPYKEYERKYIDGVKTNETRYTGTLYNPIIEMPNTSIRVAKIETSYPNSVGGVDLDIYWSNQSDKIIKYITFSVQAYNAVGDAVQCEVRRTSMLYGKSTGPIAKCSPMSGGTEDPNWYYDDFTKEYELLVGDGNEYLRSGTTDNLWEWIKIKDEQFKLAVKRHTWENAWYNNTIKSAMLTEVQITYMDNSKETISGKDIWKIQY